MRIIKAEYSSEDEARVRKVKLELCTTNDGGITSDEDSDDEECSTSPPLPPAPPPSAAKSKKAGAKKGRGSIQRPRPYSFGSSFLIPKCVYSYTETKLINNL